MAKKLWAILTPFVILLLGLIGYMAGEGVSFSEALLNSLKLLRGFLDPLPVNAAIELARWLGIVYIFSMFYAAIIALINSGAVFFRAGKEDTVAIHGDSIYASKLASALGRKAIRTNSKFSFKAPVQVVFFSNDKDTLDFYQRHSEQFENVREVHLCLNDTYRSVGVKDNVYIVNISESKAINYWQKHYIHEHAKLAIIGCGHLAEKILFWGLQMNVFDAKANVDYCVYGDFERFRMLHPDFVGKMQEYGGDNISFEREWFEHLDAIRSADRIILCGETSDNIEIATLLSEAGINNELHVFTESTGARTLFDSANIILVGDLSPDDVKDLILMDKVHESGKICNIAYDLYEQSLASETELTYDSVRKELRSEPSRIAWENLDSFTKGSNYSSAMHDQQKYELLKEAGLEVSGLSAHENELAYDALSQDVKDSLQEIEHIRWSRYHFLNNWKAPDAKADQTGSEKKKDPQKRTHANLVPYDELSKEDQDKDAYFYKTLAIRYKDEA